MAQGIGRNARVFPGERPRTYPFRLTSVTPTVILSPIQGERSIVSFRFVNTHASTTFQPMIWLVPDGETLGNQHKFYPTNMGVLAERAFMEPGTKDSPLLVCGYGDTLYAAALAGEGNLFYTVSKDV